MVRAEIEHHERARRAAYAAKIFGRVLAFIAVLVTFGTAAYLVARGFHGSAYVLASISILPVAWLALQTVRKSVEEVWILGRRSVRRRRESGERDE